MTERIERQTALLKGLDEMLALEKKRGKRHVDIRASDVRDFVYGPNPNIMPSVCRAMRKRMKIKDEIIRAPKGGDSTAVVIRYYLD